ncbi:reticuline oxidase [Cryptomeria japonica]|uniref:reticuline oxidase n=1 Tax=Cryptomeria japonica TaxID=3369 RepID=UPI0025AC0684|nr:reticuline oxidase [Cryptomeria japonica]
MRSKTEWAEAGATVGQLYSDIASNTADYSFPAGTCPTMGTGGHCSGGGMSLLSRKYGLAADNIIDALLVDANSNLLDRKSMGEDLFWALRGGGGGSWGVVVAWKVGLVRVPSKVTVFMVFMAKSGDRPSLSVAIHCASVRTGSLYSRCNIWLRIARRPEGH